MTPKCKTPGRLAGRTGGKALILADQVNDTTAPTYAANAAALLDVQAARLLRLHPVSVPVARVLAGLAFGEG